MDVFNGTISVSQTTICDWGKDMRVSDYDYEQGQFFPAFLQQSTNPFNSISMSNGYSNSNSNYNSNSNSNSNSNNSLGMNDTTTTKTNNIVEDKLRKMKWFEPRLLK